MKNKEKSLKLTTFGFTLIELLGVIVILSLLVTLVFPSVINFIKSSNQKNDNMIYDLVYNAADLFVSNNLNEFPRKNGNKYIIEIQDLIDSGFLPDSMKLSSVEDINETYVLAAYNKDKFEYIIRYKKNLEHVHGNNDLIINTKNYDFYDFKIYGNCGQDGEPTLDNPVEIQCVGDKTINLFDPKSEATKIIADNYYGINLTDIGNQFTVKISLKDGKSVPMLPYFGLVYMNADSTNPSAEWFKQQESTTLSKTLVTSPTTDVTEIGLGVYPATQENWNAVLDAFDIFIVEGSYTDSTIPDYEPYGYKIPINIRGKNLIKYPYMSTTMTSNGITFTDNGDGTITVNGTATENAIFNIRNSMTSVWDGLVHNKTYVAGLISNNTNINEGVALYINYYPSGSSSYISWLTIGINKFKSAVPPNDMAGLRVYLIVYKGATVENVIFKPHLEPEIFKSEKIEYEPYIKPITLNIYLDEPLRKVGDYVDYIDLINKRVYRNVEVIDKTETLSIEKSFKGVNDVYGTPIVFSDFATITGPNIIKVNTEIEPSNIILSYYKNNIE